MDCALTGGLRASPSGAPAQAPHGVGCGQRPSHEHERPASRLRVRSFPATIDPAGNTTSADFSTASDALTSIAVPPHPASTPSVTGHPGTPAEISTGKTSNLHRTPTAFTERPLDDIGLRLVVQTRPDRPALYAQPTDAIKAPMRHVFLGSRLRTPASSPPSLTTSSCHRLVVGAINLHRGLAPPSCWSCRAHTGRARFRASGSSKPWQVRWRDVVRSARWERVVRGSVHRDDRRGV